MADFENRLIKNLYRALCPDPVQLGEYRLGNLPKNQAEAIHQHLYECPRCRAELALLEDYLNIVRPDIEYNLADQVKIWIARLLPAPGPALAPAFAVRGETASELLRYVFGEDETGGELVIGIQEDITQPGRKSILGLVAGVPFAGLAATLWQAGRPVAQAEVDEFGNLAFANLFPGVYDLFLSGNNVEIHAQNLKV